MPENVKIQIITGLADYEKTLELRRKVFMEEGGETELEQFDGNDLPLCTHIGAFSDGELVGCMRLRLATVSDGGIMMWERFATWPRNIKTLFRLADYAHDYTRSLGFHRAWGIVEDERLLGFWKRRGCRETGEPTVYFRGHGYIPLEFPIRDPMPYRPTAAELVALDEEDAAA